MCAVIQELVKVMLEGGQFPRREVKLQNLMCSYLYPAARTNPTLIPAPCPATPWELQAPSRCSMAGFRATVAASRRIPQLQTMLPATQLGAWQRDTVVGTGHPRSCQTVVVDSDGRGINLVMAANSDFP